VIVDMWQCELGQEYNWRKGKE